MGESSKPFKNQKSNSDISIKKIRIMYFIRIKKENCKRLKYSKTISVLH